jgi:hypothetical protein
LTIQQLKSFQSVCSEQERVASLQSECDQLRRCNSELLSDMAVCRGKEAELLEYTQQVTEKNVLLQSGYSAVESKVRVVYFKISSSSASFIKDARVLDVYSRVGRFPNS